MYSDISKIESSFNQRLDCCFYLFIFGISFIQYFVLCVKLCVLICSYCTGTEWTGSKQRMLAGIITDYFFGFGYIFLAGVAYLIRDWRKLQLAISAPGFLFIFYIW